MPQRSSFDSHDNNSLKPGGTTVSLICGEHRTPTEYRKSRDHRQSPDFEDGGVGDINVNLGLFCIIDGHCLVLGVAQNYLVIINKIMNSAWVLTYLGMDWLGICGVMLELNIVSSSTHIPISNLTLKLMSLINLLKLVRPPKLLLNRCPFEKQSPSHAPCTSLACGEFWFNDFSCIRTFWYHTESTRTHMPLSKYRLFFHVWCKDIIHSGVVKAKLGIG